MPRTMPTQNQQPTAQPLPTTEPFPLEDFSLRAADVVPTVARGSFLDVTIQWGSAVLEPSEAERLRSGSVVRLDEPVTDAVDVYAAGHLIARGEALVSDGRLGVRITEIVGDVPSGPDGDNDR